MSPSHCNAAQLEDFRNAYQRDGVVHVPGLLGVRPADDSLCANRRRDHGRTPAAVRVRPHFLRRRGADSAGLPWHHDIASFPRKGQQIPSLWIAMNDIDTDMSPLHCIRGSHRNPTQFRPPVYIEPGAALPAGYGDMPDVESKLASGEYERLSWDIRSGDALLIHPYTLHGAPPNRSDKARVAFTTRWAGDDVTWTPDAFSMKVPGLDLSRVPIGQRPDGPLFPYFRRGSGARSEALEAGTHADGSGPRVTA